MLRSFLIYLSQASWARRLVTRWNFAWRSASRFIAGERLEDAIRVVKELNSKGIQTSLDHLGEHTNTAEEAKQATEDVLKIIRSIDEAQVRSNVSLKLTQIGVAVGLDLCRENLARILSEARQHNMFVRLDMEDSPWVATTLAIFRSMRDERGLDNVGLVIQSYLFRSAADIEALGKEGARIRLCKGAYQEPVEIAYPKKSDVDHSYDVLASRLMDAALVHGSQPASADGKWPPIPGLATHDERRIENARAYAQQIGLPKNALEFQMLYGIRRDLQEKLVTEGYPVRVYVPYGTEWYPYFVRRLAERPANVWFFLSNFFRG